MALQLARQSLTAHFKGKLPPPATGLPPIFQRRWGLFVTLKKRGQLRGCLGQIEPQQPLKKLIPQLAQAAALADPRFPPLTARELPQITIEISLLSPPRQLTNWRQIKLGRDGVIIQWQKRRGVFLPQVAKETGWSREKFLQNLCQQKLGLAADCYRWPESKIFSFQCQVFAEE